MSYTEAPDGSLTVGDDASNPTDDLQKIADLAIRVGGLVKKTAAERQQLTASQVRRGWLIAETDTGNLYMVTAEYPQGRLIYAPDTSWQNCPPLMPGWTAEGSDAIQYRVQSGVLYFRGRVNATANAGNQLFQTPLPANARVGVDDPVIASETGTAMNRVVVSILAIGHLVVYKGSGTPTQLSLATIPGRPVG